jgi:signal transduction histidine kinase
MPTADLRYRVGMVHAKRSPEDPLISESGEGVTDTDPSSPSHGGGAKRGEKRSLLIVEDSIEDQQTYQRLMTQHRKDDFVITMTDSGAGGLELFQTSNPDCVLLDYILPDFDGLEFLDRLGKISGTDCLPVIMLTGLGNEAVAVEAMKRGAQDYLVKSTLTPHLLRLAVQNAIEKVALRHRIRELAQAKTDFLSTASHELRTPLTIIREFVALVRDGITGPVTNDQAEGLDTALKNCDRLGTLINSILDLQRLESGAQRLNRGRVDITQILSRCVHDFLPVCRKKSQDCKFADTGTILNVLADPDAITQAVVNLIGNAHKFTPEGGRIQVSAMRSDENPDFLKIDVADTGEGISPDDVDRIFEKFSQVESGHGTGTRGTGLGLAIVRTIVTRHDGDITLVSTPGKGSTFSFTLPIYSEAKHLVALSRDARWAAHAHNKELCITLVKLVTGGPDPLGASAGGTIALLARLDQAIRHTLRKKNDVSLILPSEAMLAITTEMDGASGMDPVRQRIANAIVGETGGAYTAQIATGMVTPYLRVEDTLAALRQHLVAVETDRTQPRVLIINGNPSLSHELDLALAQSNLGLIVVLAADGYEGCLRYGSLAPDLVILDVASVKGSAKQILHHLKAASSGHEIKVLLTSVSAGEHQLMSELGASAVLIGPIEIPRIIEWVARLLDLTLPTTRSNDIVPMIG